jgi:hypothetical protein
MPFDQPVEIAEMNYTHLTREERYQIYALKKAGHTQVEIAQVLVSSSVHRAHLLFAANLD